MYTLHMTKNSQDKYHAAPQDYVCSYVPHNVLQISHYVPQRTPWHFRLGSFHYSKLIWVLIQVTTRGHGRVKTVWPFHDNTTQNLISIIQIGPLRIHISSSALVEELYR